MKKRLLSILLAACLLAGLLPATALAAGGSGSTPSVWAYATKTQLTDNTFSPDYTTGIPVNIGKLTFGNKYGSPLEWYILGAATVNGNTFGEDAIIFAATTISGTSNLAGTSCQSYSPSWGCSYLPEYTIIEVNPNHYGGSTLRSEFNADSHLKLNFTEAELGMIENTTLLNWDSKNSVRYNTTDKLYLLADWKYYQLVAGGLEDALKKFHMSVY